VPPPTFPQGSDLRENAVRVNTLTLRDLMCKVGGSYPLHNENLHEKCEAITATMLKLEVCWDLTQVVPKYRKIVVPEDGSSIILRNVGK
jgi:hypothetical protein